LVLPQYKALLRAAVPFLFLSLLLAGCGTAPQSTTQEQNLQGTVSALQTQVASQRAPTATLATTAPAQEPTSLPPTNTVISSNPQEYLATSKQQGVTIYFLSWTEKNGHIIGDITAAIVQELFSGEKRFRILRLPVRGTRRESSIDFVILTERNDCSEYTGSLEDGGNILKLNFGEALVFQHASKQDFDKAVAALNLSVTPTIEPTSVQAATVFALPPDTPPTKICP
jgi:hypothetical protein